jgi:hypothetical protein
MINRNGHHCHGGMGKSCPQTINSFVSSFVLCYDEKLELQTVTADAHRMPTSLHGWMSFKGGIFFFAMDMCPKF